MSLNEKHINMIFDATEHHFKWYDKYYVEEVTFIKLLEINTEKITKFIEKNENVSDDKIEEEILKLRKEYINRFLKTKKNRK